jgi:hypothetical protein
MTMPLALGPDAQPQTFCSSGWSCCR